MVHYSTHWLLPYNRTEWMLAGWAEWVMFQGLLETTGTELVATFGAGRIRELIQTNRTVLI